MQCWEVLSAYHADEGDPCTSGANQLPEGNLELPHLTADSDGALFSEAIVQRVRERHFQHHQHASTTVCSQRVVNHCISKALVQKARTIRKARAVEDLTQIRERGTVRRAQSHVRHHWAFRELRTLLTSKAQRDGILLVAVDPRNTSRICPV